MWTISIMTMLTAMPTTTHDNEISNSHSLLRLYFLENMKVTNYEPANQFIKREYRKG